MRGIITGVSAGTALTLLLMAASVPTRAENVPLHTVPKPVLDAVRARFKDAKIEGAEKERGHRGFVYEVTIKHQGKNVDVTLTPEGTILLIKREIAPPDLPEPVAKTLAETYPGAAYHAIEAVIRVQGSQEKLAYYEVDLVTAQRRIVEVRVNADGRILKGEQ